MLKCRFLQQACLVFRLLLLESDILIFLWSTKRDEWTCKEKCSKDASNSKGAYDAAYVKEWNRTHVKGDHEKTDCSPELTMSCCA